MLRASAILMSLASLLSLSAIATAAEPESLIKAGDFVRVSQRQAQSMWTIFLLPKGYPITVKAAKIQDASIYEVKAAHERGLSLIGVNKDGAQKRYEKLIPWHAVAVIMRETEEPIDGG